MTKEEILKMEASREMDALVAEKVMGICLEENVEIRPEETEATRTWICKKCGKVPIIKTPPDYKVLSTTEYKPIMNPFEISNYSTSISAAWEVALKFSNTWLNLIARDLGLSNFGLTAYPDKGWSCRMGTKSAYGETAPLAICRAALLAMMEEK